MYNKIHHPMSLLTLQKQYVFDFNHSYLHIGTCMKFYYYGLDNLLIVLITSQKMSLVVKYATVWCHRGAIKS